jgi:hypothetical protein
MTCIIVGTNLWIASPGMDSFQAVKVTKPEGSEFSYAWDAKKAKYRFDIQQYQLRMGSDEFVGDCIASGLVMDSPPGPFESIPALDDIDEKENE